MLLCVLYDYKMVNRDTVTKSLFWKFLERCTAQLITLIIGIILARLLAPEDFGALSILMVFVGLSVILTEAGFNTALIQKVDTDEKDYGTVLIISLLIAAILYLSLFLLAPFIASFYSYAGLDNTMKVIALVLFPNAINSVFTAKVSREFQYKKLFYANLGGSVISGLVGVFLAYAGFNLWALVIQQLLGSFLICVILRIQLRWWPKLCYSSERAKRLFSFGWKLMVANVADSLFSNFRALLIGKAFDTNALGYYSQAQQYPQAISKNINSSIGSVMLPTLSNVQDNLDTVKAMTRRSIKLSTYLVFPVLLGFAAISDSFVSLVLTEKWAPCIILIKILCVMFLFEPLITINSQARNAIGKSGIHLFIVIIAKAFDLGVLVFTWLVFNTIEAIAIGQVISAVFNAIVGGVINNKLIGYRIKEQLLDVIPNFIVSLIMYVIVSLLLFLQWPLILTLFSQVLIGGISYILMSKFFRNESYNYLKDYVVQKINRKQ